MDLQDVYVGRNAVIEASRHYWGTWDDYRLEAEELIDAGSPDCLLAEDEQRVVAIQLA